MDIILGFVVRKAFIDFIGIDMLGLNGTFTSILSTLSLAELGFESAVIFSLYRPMKEENKSEIEETVAILKRIYEFVGGFVIVAGFLISLGLPYIIKGIAINAETYASFYVQLIGTASTYFFAYKKTFLLAQQKDYVRTLFMSGSKIIATVIQIISIYTLHSFLFYVAVGTIQNVAASFLTSKYVDNKYDYNFKRNRIDQNIFRRLLSDVKEIFFGKLAGYIYSSTDSLIISAFVGTISVGILGNYTQILYQMKTVVNNMFMSTKPIIGHFLIDETDKTHTFQILQNYTFIRFAAAVCLFVPGYVLSDSFISSWVGADYVLPKLISLLLVLDIFIHFVHGALVDYIAGLGYFKLDRNISIIGALINIVLSISLVNSMGLSGVLIGTVVSQTFFWISRSISIFKYYFENSKVRFWTYWRRCILYIITFFILCFGCERVFELIPMSDSYFKFIIGGFTCYTIIIPIMYFIFSKTEEFAYSWRLCRKLLETKIHKK